MTSIGSSAFSGCNKLKNVYYKGTIEDWCNIEFSNYDSNPMSYASHFYMLDENNGWYEVTEIVVPSTITRIGDYQFYGFSFLRKVTFEGECPRIGSDVFGNVWNYSDFAIYVKAEFYEDYLNVNDINWETYLVDENKIKTY